MTVSKPKTIKKYFTPNKYSRPRTKRSKTTKTAWHYTGKAGVSALSTWNYFESLKTGQYYMSGGVRKYLFASSHFIVGLDGEIYECMPLSETAYTTNAANSYSIGIECATTGSDDHYTDEQYKSMVHLGAWLAQEYRQDPREDAIRHKDVTGKICPRYFVNHPDKWKQFKLDQYNLLKGKIKLGDIKNCTNGKGNTQVGSSTVTYKDKRIVNISGEELNIRSTADWNAKPSGVIKRGGNAEVVAKVDAKNGSTDMYKLKNGKYATASTKFVKLEDIPKPKPEALKPKKKYIYNVYGKSINVRSTADWKGKVIGQMKPDEVYTLDKIVTAKNGSTKMYKTISGSYVTASSKYTKIVEK